MSTNKDAKAGSNAPKAAASSSQGGGALPVIALVAGLAGIGAAGAVYVQHQSLQQSTAANLESSSRSLESAVSDITQATSAVKTELNSNITSLQGNVEEKINALDGRLNSELSDTNTKLDQALGALNDALSGKLDTAVSGMSDKLEATIDNFKEQIQQTQMMINQNQRDWMMAEVEYLLRMAKHRVVLAADIESSVQALKSADLQIAALNEIELLPVRQQISEEIAELRNQQQPDIEGLIFTISRLAKSAESMPVPAPEAAAEQAGEGTLSSKLPNFSFTGLLNQFEVKKPEGINDSIIGSPSEEQLASSEIIRLHLQAAQLAAVRRDQTAFNTHIDSAIEETNTRYETAHPRVSAFLNDLAEINEAPINPVAAKLGQSLQLLNEINTKLGVE